MRRSNSINTKRCRIDPKSKLISVFEWLYAINLLYISICVPIQVGYTIHFSDFFIITEILSEIVSVANILIKIRTPIEV